MSSFIPVDLSDVEEASAVPEGNYTLRIAKVEDAETKKSGDPMKVLTLVIEDSEYPNPAPLKHWLVLPTDAHHPNFHIQALNLKRFFAAFGIPLGDGGYDHGAIEEGLVGECTVVQETGDDGIVRNKLRLPRLKG